MMSFREMPNIIVYVLILIQLLLVVRVPQMNKNECKRKCSSTGLTMSWLSACRPCASRTSLKICEMARGFWRYSKSCLGRLCQGNAVGYSADCTSYPTLTPCLGTNDRLWKLITKHIHIDCGVIYIVEILYELPVCHSYSPE